MRFLERLAPSKSEVEDLPEPPQEKHVVRLLFDFLVPVCAVMTSEAWFAEWGLSFLGAMTVTMGYAFVSVRRALRRAEVRKRLKRIELLDGVGVVEDRRVWLRDFPYDFVSAGALAVLASVWLYPTAARLLELGFLIPGVALSLGTGVLGFGGLLSLREGIGRFRDYRKAVETLESGPSPVRDGEELLQVSAVSRKGPGFQ